MNEEELQKIQSLLDEYENDYDKCVDDFMEVKQLTEKLIQKLSGDLDLYEKQRREISQLEDDNYRLDKENQIIFETMQEKYISKDKVKEILKELENYNFKGNFDDVDFIQNIIQQFKELLGD